ncbi:tetratricopeptide repeat protein [Chitinimonas sp. BJB300]|uniref:tetratricopeptide repeat protein n=1 Tax=Chitinimonas sp. BJB300 TaxID=1559339 RepID=UPI0013047931|nr:tetratricopeptide repeat protein [Chitinimonas sp. BJB300]
MSQSMLQQAFALHQDGMLDRAEQLYRLILSNFPEHPDASYLLGTLLLLRNDAEAVPLLQSTIKTNPEHWQANYNLGLWFLRNGKIIEARRLLSKACELNPEHAEGHVNLGYVGVLDDDPLLVINEMARALELNPKLDSARKTLIAVFIDQGRFAKAMSLAVEWSELPFQEITSKPILARALAKGRLFSSANQILSNQELEQSVSAFTDIGAVLQYQSLCYEAQLAYKRAIELQYDCVEAHFNLSLVLLLSGRFEEGWKEFEWRSGLSGPVKKYEINVPEWDGRTLSGEAVLVHSEQGLGDVIQFMRFFPKMEELGARILFTSYPDIIQLLKSQSKAEVRDDVENFDLSYKYQISLLSLGKLFGNTEEAIRQSSRRYIEAPEEKSIRWNKKIVMYPGLKVGLVWAGNPKHLNDQNRSMALSDFSSLVDIPGITFFGLQVGPFSKQTSLTPAGMNLVDFSEGIIDFTDTAAIIANLDLVICVDTSVAHLAGALGKPVWLLLPYFNDWRWLLNRTDTPWYDSMRIWRQSSAREGWPEVVTRIRASLIELVEQRFCAEEMDSVTSSVWRARHYILNNEKLIDWNNSPLVKLLPDLPSAWVFTLSRMFKPEDLPTAFQAWFLTQPYWMGKYLEVSDDTTAAIEKYLIVPNDNEYWRLANWAACELLWARKDIDRLSDRVVVLLLQDAEEVLWQYWQAQVDRMQERYQAAIDGYQSYLSIYRRSAEARINLGLSYWKVGNNDLALEQFERAVMCNATNVTGWFYLGWFLYETNKLKAAYLVFDELADWFPENGQMRLWRGNLLQRLGRHQEALEEVECAFNIDSTLENIEYRLVSAKTAAVPTVAGVLMEEYLQKQPNDLKMRLRFALHLLGIGDFERGWSEFESRLDIPNSDSVKNKLSYLQIPRWDGSSLNGRHLLVFCECGYGDTFNFLHFIRYLKDCTVTLVVQDGLLPLLNCADVPCFLVDRTGLRADVGGYPFDTYIEIMSLPHMLRINEGTALKVSSNLQVDCSNSHLFKYFEDICEKKVGIIWGGNPNHLNTNFRDCPLEYWIPLLNIDGVFWMSLQKDLPSNQAVFLPEVAVLNNIAVECEDWLDTAAVIKQLDLLITVDTAVAHLAAIMGKPVWLLLSKEVDWRWGQSGEDTIWYSNVRLFRQDELNDWESVIAKVSRALKEDTQHVAEPL